MHIFFLALCGLGGTFGRLFVKLCAKVSSKAICSSVRAAWRAGDVGRIIIGGDEGADDVVCADGGVGDGDAAPCRKGGTITGL